MLTLPRLSRIFNTDNDFMVIPAEINWPNSSNDNFRSVNNRPNRRLGVPFTANGQYSLCLDMRQFDPKIITVKVENNLICVNAKNENNSEDHYEFCEYSHKFSVPNDVIIEQMKCKMDRFGLLQIDAPLKDCKKVDDGQEIPIEFIK